MNLYLDLDGVLCDFLAGLDSAGGVDQFFHGGGWGEETVDYDELYSFFANLEWIHGGRQVWRTASALFSNIYVLSSAGAADDESYEAIRKGKEEWVKKNLKTIPDDRILVTFGPEDKIEYANRNSVLVDDMLYNIDPWIRAGGRGILHHSDHYQITLRELEDLAIPSKLTEIVKGFSR